MNLDTDYVIFYVELSCMCTEHKEYVFNYINFSVLFYNFVEFTIVNVSHSLKIVFGQSDVIFTNFLQSEFLFILY